MPCRAPWIYYILHAGQELSNSILNVSYKNTLNRALKPSGLKAVSLQRAASDVM